MRHEFTRRCITLGSAVAMGLLAATAIVQADQTEAEPKQKALISFKLDVLSRFKKDEPASVVPAEAKSEVVAVNVVEPLPSGTARTQAIAAANSQPAEPLPPTSLVTGPAAQPLSVAAAQGQFPSVTPPSTPPVQLTSGQFPLPPANQMPFQTAQSPVVIMMPAGWQPDGSYTFAPRTVLSPEVPAEHWPTSHRNPLGDDSRKGLFDWPQIARKITNSTVGEPELKPQPPAPAPSTSRALFAVAPAATQSVPTQSQPLPAQPQAIETYAAAPAPQPAPAAPEVPQSVEQVQPASKALFAPQPKQPEPQPEESKTRALFSLLSKPMTKPAAAPANTAGSKALFAFGRKKDEPAAAPAPAVVPQYAAETPLPPEQSMPTVTPTTTVESVDPEVQPPAPPSVANPLPGKLETVQSDDPKMKWRSKGAPREVAASATVRPDAVATPASAAQDVAGEHAVTTAAASTAAAEQPIGIERPLAPHANDSPAINSQATQPHAQSPATTAVTLPVSSERSLLGKHFPTMAGQTPRNANDNRSPWRRQAERDAIEAAEKRIEQPVAESKAILPNVAALFPAVEKPSRPVHTHAAPQVTTVAATEDQQAMGQPHSVRRAHETSARSTESYYADPWEHELEAELSAIERRQIGSVSNRRAAIARQAIEREPEPSPQAARVPFEIDELEQEKMHLRRSAKISKPAPTMRPKSNAPAGSPSNGARIAEQHAKKSYRRLSGADLKQGFTRPLAIFSNMTKLPTTLKSAADNFEPDPSESTEEFISSEADERYDLEVEEELPQTPAAAKRSAAMHQPVRELRQSTAATSSAMGLEDRALQSSHPRQPPKSVGQRGGRRQVERTARPRPVQEEMEASGDEDSGVVTAEDAVPAEEEEISVDHPVRPAMHIRNKHGNQVKIFGGGAGAGDSSDE